ncbi:hypothetical protein DFH11DRAFT_1514426 [Phellopilus nigrolimitatus]|nr:hypothetical protein DFH11DRAFT_1514426 [Phellopilus nigrolimitatus]
MGGWLFPGTHSYTLAWTTSAQVDLPSVTHVELADKALDVHRVDSRTPSHDIVLAPNVHSAESQKAWQAFFPNGSINPGSEITGGFGFYMCGPKDFKDALHDAKEVLFGYSVLFEEQWEWVKGGKLPGAFGGFGSSAYKCTGGQKEDRDTCFNLRLMWRANGAGELYAYLPLIGENSSRLLSVPPRSIRNPDYGFSVGRGAFVFKPGVWTTVTERVKLNDVGVANGPSAVLIAIFRKALLISSVTLIGEIELRVNGDTVILATGLIIRTMDETRIRGMHFQTFFGGHSGDWAARKDQYAWFSDVSGAIIA